MICTAWIVLANCCAVNPTQRTIPLFDINPNGMTITSLLYNFDTHSEWVDHIFGSKAVFHHKNNVEELEHSPLTEDEINERHVNTMFKIPPHGLIPRCSFELLGFVRLGDEAPFKQKDKMKSPAIGLANVKIKSHHFSCFFRPLYENWRPESTTVKTHYWAIVLYCPTQNRTICSSLPSHFEPRTKINHPAVMKIEVKIHLQSSNLSSTFTARVSDQSDVIKSSKSDLLSTPVGICTAIPYASSDPEKAQANGAMLAEWIRHHSSLGMKVIVYDRHGNHFHHIFNSSYAREQSINNMNLVYHNFTIRELLDNSDSGARYDNSEHNNLNRRVRNEMNNDDKTLTLTHCRFEARALYGLVDVMVVDFDEFVLCPQVAPDPRAQAHYFSRLITDAHHASVDQLLLLQRLPMNKTASPRDCVVANARRGHSIFDCFAAYEYASEGHSWKSVHLSHKCPLTGYHQACATPSSPRGYNCDCRSLLVRPDLHRDTSLSLELRGCVLMHLSTLSADYARQADVDADVLRNLEGDALVRARRKPMEMWRIAHPKRNLSRNSRR